MARPRDTETYQNVNKICYRAGHDDPDSLDPMTRFQLALRHAMGNPIVVRPHAEDEGGSDES